MLIRRFQPTFLPRTQPATRLLLSMCTEGSWRISSSRAPTGALPFNYHPSLAFPILLAITCHSLSSPVRTSRHPLESALLQTTQSSTNSPHTSLEASILASTHLRRPSTLEHPSQMALPPKRPARPTTTTLVLYLLLFKQAANVPRLHPRHLLRRLR